ncbi:MAG: hypothetical protein L3K07_00060 [Thermoplasmata archaeon]|nr:hypothetical protein [Thermoplasmata archaeon]
MEEAPEETAPLELEESLGASPEDTSATPELEEADPSIDAGEEPPVVPTPHRQGRLLIVVSVVLVVLLLLAAALYTGTLGPNSKSRNAPPAPNSMSFSAAFAAVNSSAQSVSGGPWALVAAVGLDVLANGTNPFSFNSTASGVCATGAPPPLVLASTTDAVRGLSPYWVISFESTSSNSILDAVVANGQAQILGTTPPTSHCFGPGRVGTLPPVGNIEDSAQLAPALPSLTLFSMSYPNATIVFSLSGEGSGIGRSSGTAYWLVEGSPCFGPGGTSTSSPAPGDPVYQGGANATSSGNLGDRIIPGIGRCETPGTLAPSLQLFASQLVLAGSGYGYVSAVRSVANGVTPGMFRPVVVASEFVNPGIADPQSQVTGFDVIALNGSTVAVFNTSVDAWTQGGNLPLTATDSLRLLTTSQIDGASLVLEANFPESGEIGISLP